jgi:DnaJ family protein B protein 12
VIESRIMESNKEESIRCLEIAENFLQSGDNDKAEKFAQKSLKLFPSDKAKELISRISKSRKTKENRRTDEQINRGTDEQTNRQTDNQNYVQRVLKSDNYYDILGVLKEATNDDMKKSLWKLAKQLHPDKNKVPGAAEAFIKVKGQRSKVKGQTCFRSFVGQRKTPAVRSNVSNRSSL